MEARRSVCCSFVAPLPTLRAGPETCRTPTRYPRMYLGRTPHTHTPQTHGGRRCLATRRYLRVRAGVIGRQDAHIPLCRRERKTSAAPAALDHRPRGPEVPPAAILSDFIASSAGRGLGRLCHQPLAPRRCLGLGRDDDHDNCGREPTATETAHHKRVHANVQGQTRPIICLPSYLPNPPGFEDSEQPGTLHLSYRQIKLASRHLRPPLLLSKARWH